MTFNPTKVKAPTKVPSFTEVMVHGKRCIHIDKYSSNDICGNDVAPGRPNGWLCWEHERDLFPTMKTTTVQ